MSLTDKIALFSAFGSWISGVGAIFAVIVSLYLANRKPKLKIDCQFSIIRRMQQITENEITFHFGLAIKVINQSVVSVRINDIFFDVGKRADSYLVFSKDLHGRNSIKLDYSEEEIIRLEHEDRSWIDNLIVFIGSNDAKPSDLRLVIHLSTGKIFYYKLNPDVIELINKEINFRKSS